jgi:hypothetical protein
MHDAIAPALMTPDLRNMPAYPSAFAPTKMAYAIVRTTNQQTLIVG